MRAGDAHDELYCISTVLHHEPGGGGSAAGTPKYTSTGGSNLNLSELTRLGCNVEGFCHEGKSW